MDPKIYLCPGKNPNHYAYKLDPLKECILDYEHSIERVECRSFNCIEDINRLSPSFNTEVLHWCSNRINKYIEHGCAVDMCREDDYGRLWVDNGEYGSMVQYCPFCGFKGRNLDNKVLL
jgi:hypothetical protein